MNTRNTVSVLALLGGFVTQGPLARAIPPSEAAAAAQDPVPAPPAAIPSAAPVAARPVPLARPLPAPIARPAPLARPIPALAQRAPLNVAPHLPVPVTLRPAVTPHPVAATTPVTAQAPTPPVTAPSQAPAAPSEAAATPVHTTPLALRPGQPLSLVPEAPPSGNGWKVLAIAAALGGGLWFARRKQTAPASGPRRSLEILRRTSIGVRSELLIVNVGNQTLLLGVTPNSIQNLAVLGDTEAVATPAVERDSEEGDATVADRFAAALEAATAPRRAGQRPVVGGGERSAPARIAVGSGRPPRPGVGSSLASRRRTGTDDEDFGDDVEEQARGLMAIGRGE